MRRLKKSLSVIIATLMIVFMCAGLMASALEGSQAQRVNHSTAFTIKNYNIKAIVGSDTVVVGVLQAKCTSRSFLSNLETVTARSSLSAENTSKVSVNLVTGVDTGSPSYYDASTTTSLYCSKSANHKGAAATYGGTIRF